MIKRKKEEKQLSHEKRRKESCDKILEDRRKEGEKARKIAEKEVIK